MRSESGRAAACGGELDPVPAGRQVNEGVGAVLPRHGEDVAGGPGLALSGYSTDLVTLADRAGGSYQVNGLAPGRYQLTFDDPACLEQELTQDDSYAPATSALVTVTAGGLAKGVNARLLRRGQITGTVTGPGDSPVAGECVRAVPAGPAADPYFGAARAAHDILAVTQRDGTYSLIDLPPGLYQVEFSSAGCGAAGFATQWWRDASSQATATVVTVGAGATASGIDADLSA
ncbi:MAG TPA: carboxypeptidase-like regulatory domain-containing protein, partial [Streptosporangiaceae bacterium]|nr:carboxypeptidase-like regulatory domain-containing protein [Streptosporangiaceae bacterium]